MRIVGGACSVQGEIQAAADWIIQTKRSLQLGHIGIVYGGFDLKLRVGREIAAIESSRAVDVKLRTSLLHNGVMQSHSGLRILHVSVQAIDMDTPSLRLGRRGWKRRT